MIGFICEFVCVCVRGICTYYILYQWNSQTRQIVEDIYILEYYSPSY